MTADDPSAQDAAFFELLVESGLVSVKQLEVVRAAQPGSGLRLDEILVARGVVAADALLKVVSRAWHLPPIYLARTHVDKELVRQWPGQRYLAENWMPVRDQANGTVLVATARIPNEERAVHIASFLQNPVEFVAATSTDIRMAVLRAFVPDGHRAVLAGLRILRRDRERSTLVR